MGCIIHPTYFPNIAHMAVFAQHKSVAIEICDNYTKQTYRNRACIYGANGKLQLNIPIHHTQKERQLYKDVKIVNDTKWQIQHLKSLESAYRTSPFFEFYEDDIRPLFEIKTNFLLDFNLKCLEVILETLDLEVNTTQTTLYVPSIENDFRTLVHCKKEVPQSLESYTQVFKNKHGFIPNLSILDLIFNQGPNSLLYLEQQQIVS